jgi:formamidopyrimidine-DNA glycosylase
MPELPEVETMRRGLAPLIVGKTIAEIILRTGKLRWPLDPRLTEILPGQQILGLDRRAKYLLLTCDRGGLILHLGMSGNLRVIPAATPIGKHDHVDLVLTEGSCLRLNDPRKFGALLWTDGHPLGHPLLAGLGPEPLTGELSGEYLYRQSRSRNIAVKLFIMDQKLLVGVGNIYASEALFRAGIRPDRPAGKISRRRYDFLLEEIRQVLAAAIAAGGTTIQDFRQNDGRPGYFQQQLQVYGRAGEPCRVCGTAVSGCRLGQRSTYFCRRCQR